jgi:hypothetical protein
MPTACRTLAAPAGNGAPPVMPLALHRHDTDAPRHLSPRQATCGYLVTTCPQATCRKAQRESWPASWSTSRQIRVGEDSPGSNRRNSPIWYVTCPRFRSQASPNCSRLGSSSHSRTVVYQVSIKTTMRSAWRTSERRTSSSQTVGERRGTLVWSPRASVNGQFDVPVGGQRFSWSADTGIPGRRTADLQVRELFELVGRAHELPPDRGEGGALAKALGGGQDKRTSLAEVLGTGLVSARCALRAKRIAAAAAVRSQSWRRR